MQTSLKRNSGVDMNRRSFLSVSTVAAGGLLVSLYLDFPAFAQEGGPAPPPKVYPPDAFVRIETNGKIFITVNRLEFGQGVQTSLPMVLADELDADWSQVVAELAPAAEVYKDPLFGIQMVGGSGSISHSFQQYRELGAKTRAMLIAAAADRWKVSPSDCRAENSVVHGPGGKSARYAELSEAAARQPVPNTVRLKNPSEFRLIGKKVPRLDSRAKCDGSQKFGLDLDLPGMKIAVVAHPPVFGGRVKSFDDKEARSLSGVKDIFQIPLAKGTGVAVVADRFWTAKQARDRLKIEWDLSGLELADSTQLWAKFKELARGPGNVAVARGDDKAMSRTPAARRIVAEYEFPYLAHTPMEPLNATVRFEGDKAEAWVPSQFQTL
ncbi:MAG: molybdopterin cofactor-binding domain-containing protein, partial [Pyrinomonadaceae bacterium]